MQTVVIVIHLMVVLAMIGAVLLQKSEGGGLGMGGSGGGFLTSRGTANVLTRTTAILALVFFTTSLTLSILAGLERKPTSILNSGSPSSGQPVPGGTQAPLGQGSGGILPQLQGQGQQGQGQPPAEPQVPPSR
jgi:preprotein translocase subunit SecG